MGEAPTSSSTTENSMDVSNQESTSLNTSSSTENSKINTHIVIGCSDFKKVIGSAPFVDKTLLIKDFVKSVNQVVLITCPRRFGKSTNMSMIKLFLEMEVNNDGRMIQLDNLAKKNLFEKHANLNIMQESDIFDDYFAQHPVIFVNFLNATGNT